MFPEPREFSASDLHAGLSAEFERAITEADVVEFARVSGDFNPLHVDAGYAQTTRFGGRIVHGAFQVALASRLIGMHLPGRSVLLGGVSARFPAPLYFPCQVRVRGEITAWNRQTQGGQLKVTVLEMSRQVPTAEIVLPFTLHEARPEEPPTAVLAPAPAAEVGPTGRKVVVVTGASGGLGSAIVAHLAGAFDVVALTRSQPLDDRLRGLPGVRELAADLADPDALATALGEARLFGVVHAAWPGAPTGGLLQAQDEVVQQQLLFGVATTIRLARLLFERVGPEGGRFVALGSIVGSMKPLLSMAAYSLGKGALEGAVKLLAPELARKNITINAVCPGFVPAGMNKQKGEHQQKAEAARIPLGRLCTPDDVAAAVGYLLAPGSGFISGQVLGLTGGQL